MPTIRRFISDINADSRSLNADSWISPKFIYSKARSVIGDFLKKDNSSNRMLFKDPEIWSLIPCLPMEEVPITECGDLELLKFCEKLMKSKYRLPGLYSDKFGAIIKEVISLNSGTTYYRAFSLREWKTKQLRKYGNERYYFITEGYLYIPVKTQDPIPNPITVRVEGLFKEKYEVAALNNLIDGCTNCPDECLKAIDYQMVIPTYLENDVKKEVINQLAQVYLKISPDEFPNLSQNDKVSPDSTNKRQP